MLALPDYIVLDFVEWISQNYQSNKLFLDSLLSDRELVMSYAKKYLSEQNNNYNYNKCKKILKRYIDRVIDSKEFEVLLRQNCKYGYSEKDVCYCDNHCLHMSCHEIEYLLHERFKEFTNYEIDRIKPSVLVDSLYNYIEREDIKDNPALFYLVTGCSGEDFSIILDFFNWLKEQKKTFKIYKMPKDVFDDVINKYEINRGVALSNKTKRDIVKIFKSSSSSQIYKRMKKIFGNGRSLSYVFERYYSDKAKYKCILLPLKGEPGLKKFIKKYWSDLDEASSDSLDIFYSLKELNDTGYKSLGKIRNLSVDTSVLPCVVIWQQDISLAKTISIRELSHSDLCQLLRVIISYIEKGMKLEQVYQEALKMVENLKEENKMVQKIEQNINGINYGAVTGVNKGRVQNITSSDNSSIQSDIQDAKTKIKALEELDSQMKKYICDLLEEASSSMIKNDDNMKNACVNKFNGFIAGVGKASVAILGVLGSFASIASFLGIN